MINIYTFLSLFLLLSCNSDDSVTQEIIPSEQAEEQVVLDITEQARITAVDCVGGPNNYTLSVTIESPDTGCDQYADWWEVFYPDSTLIYRRILGHSHVNEQPFTRSGSSMDVGPDEFIYVRAHMNNTGYGSQVFSGNVREGLVLDSLATDYAIGLATQQPLPDDCAF